MKKTAIAVLLIGAQTSIAVAASTSPLTSKTDAVSTYYRITVHDPYRWLENGASPATKRWIDAQNAYAENFLSRVPRGKAMAARIRRLSITSEQRSNPKIAAGKLFYLRLVPPQEQAVLVVGPWPAGKARVLVDPNQGRGLTAIADYWPSPDGRYVAYGTAEAGTEDTDFHVIEVATGRRLPDEIMHVGPQPTLAWESDERGFVYARPQHLSSKLAATVPFDTALYHHRLGTSASEDRAEFGQGFSRVAEWWLISSADGQRMAALVVKGDGPPNYAFLRGRGGRSWTQAFAPSAGVPSWEVDDHVATFAGGHFLAIATAGTPRGRVVIVQRGRLRTPVPEGSWTMRSIAPVAGGFLLTEVWGPDWRVRQFDAAGHFVRTLPLPQTGIAMGIAGNPKSSTALVAYEGWARPQRWALYDARSGALKVIFSVKAPADYSAVAIRRIDATEPDGTSVPVTVLGLRSSFKRGNAPAILTAYGAYGISSEPRFLGSYLAWIERGGLYAVANIRGGGEFGEAWHRAGALTNERHRFEDLNAAAQALTYIGLTSPTRLGITGASAGGFLMGGALITRPDLYRAVVSFAGFYDALRTEHEPNGEYNVTEFGTVNNLEQFRAMYAYSPLRRVRDGVAYPAILLITGENDPRVAPWESRKFAARLQAATASSRPIIILTRREEGHGVGASFSQRLGDRAAQLIFFASELGL